MFRKKKTVVLDFDGVFTDPVDPAEEVRQDLINNLSDLSGISRKKISEIYGRTKKRILKRPYEYGWVVGGYIAAFSDEDPFVIISSTLFEMARENPVYEDSIAKKYRMSFGEFCNMRFNEVTKNAPPCFRKNVRKALEKLTSDNDVFVVSNSETDKIERMLKEIDVEIPVYGDAKKYVIDLGWDCVDRSMDIGRYSVMLRRPYYYGVLQKVRGEKTLVVGDGFSLDLSLPYQLGMRIVLKENNYTPSWSKKFVKRNGYVAKDLMKLAEKLG